MLKLGEILVEKKLISSAQLQDMIELQILGQKKLGEILVLQGAIKPEELQLALKEQIEQQNQEDQLHSQVLNWRIQENIYQADYGDELGRFIFKIQPKKQDQLESDGVYQIQLEFHFLDEKIMSENCGNASTLQAAQQLAEEQLKQLL